MGDPIRVGGFPGGVAFTPDGTRAYTTNETANTVTVIDVATGRPDPTPIQVGTFPRGVAVTPDGTRAYTTNSNDYTVTVIDTGLRPAPTGN
jgi:YVTN family beta-propeller protein